MRTIDEILEKIKQFKGLKRDIHLAKLFKVKPSTVSSWRKRNNLPLDVIVTFCEDESINLSWLLTGQITTKYIDVDGIRVLSAASEPGIYKKDENIFKVGEEVPEYGEFVFVPQVAGEISAGGGQVPNNNIELRVAFRRDWIARKGDVKNMSLIRVTGDSMEPTLLSGDLVLVDHGRNYIDGNGGIYALVKDNYIIIKRIQVLYPENRLKIISDNPRYGPRDCDPGEIKVNGKVIWFGREVER